MAKADSKAGTTEPGIPPEPKYWAFISYNHQDDAWGRWLHRQIETYRVPRRLVGRPSRDGKVPRRMYPAYRDREELPVSADLGGNIKNCLERSRYLIVICSPNAARSAWVTEEVRQFKLTGRQDRIMALIVSGEPNAAEKPHLGLDECFPETLRHRLAPDGSLSAERVEPIAADARPHKDGRHNARLKVLAGLLGVDYDELKQRERVRSIKRWATNVAAALAIVAVGAAGWRWQDHRARLEHYLAQGRQELDGGNLLHALPWLSEAWRLGRHDDTLREMLLRSSRALVAQQVVFANHKSWVLSAAFSPDGKRLLTASWDRSVALSDAADPMAKELARFPGHRMKLSYATFSTDGSRIATACWDGTARMWDAAGNPLSPPLEHRGRVNTAVFAPAGLDLLLTASDDGTARLWRQDGTPVRTIAADDDFVKSALFSPDGARVVTASLDGTVKVWSTPDGKPLLTINAHKGGANWAAFSPDGTRIVSAGLDNTAKLWPSDQPTDQPLGTLSGHRGRLNSASFSPDGRRILTAGDDGAAIVWDALSLEMLAIIECEKSPDAKGPPGRSKVLCAAFSADARHIVTCGDDNTARIWSAEAPQRTVEETVQFAREQAPWTLANGQLVRRR
jgi:WD40 repeat protein